MNNTQQSKNLHNFKTKGKAEQRANYQPKCCDCFVHVKIANSKPAKYVCGHKWSDIYGYDRSPTSPVCKFWQVGPISYDKK